MSKESQHTTTKTLVIFPCTFSFKAVLKSSVNAIDTVTEIIQMTAQVNHEKIFSQLSKNNKYISVTVPTYLENESQLTQIYQQLYQHPKILMTL